MSGQLFICATPIGNLSDVTPRLLETLRTVDFILAEDTRVSMKLLSHHQIQHGPLISFPEGSSPAKRARVIDELLSGRNYALVSDAGTPAVSDPGADLITDALAAGVDVIPVVGPSAVTALASVMGVSYPEFHFWGFFPVKNKRVRELKSWMENVPGMHIYFDSPFRVVKNLREHFFTWDDFNCVIGRELTKKFESIYRGTPAEAVAKLEQDMVKGEFVVGLVRRDRKKPKKEEPQE